MANNKNNNPYRRRKPKRLEGCLAVIILLGFVAMNLFLLKWLVPFENTGKLPLGLNRPRDNDEENSTFHIVTSRFMQDQHNLVALSNARLRLFETFCLPTMIHQRATNFVWFLMVDPLLPQNILLRLQALLQDHDNFYLIRSNAKLPSLEDTRQAMTGNKDALESLLLDPHKHLLLETRLDADDGLHMDTLYQVQELAKALPVDTTGWQVICSKLHYEWRNNEIINASNTTTIPIQSSGSLRIVQESICVTPGYTLVRHRKDGDTEFHTWPKIGHNLVARDWPECQTKTNTTTNCWTKMGFFPSAIRSRTITSAGMSRIDDTNKKYENNTQKFWGLVERDFFVSPDSAQETSQYIKDNLESIVLDNLDGQW